MLVEKILVANRGEIACRIIKTIKKMGYTSVAIFSDADANSLHVKMADESIYIGSAEPQNSYLNIEKIIQAAKQIQADAIHPGYGFLSENAHFAGRCLQEKLIFIGPTPEAIELMGNKSQSKQAMIEAQVPCIPGYQGEDQSDEKFIEEAHKIGYPVMVKAAGGGGGRGMRKVFLPSQLKEALQSARSEALTGFNNAELILEKAIENGRHVEIQILADSFGHCIHLGERDCSLQRRHQKVIEESPSPLNRTSLRDEMGLAAIAAAETCEYIGAGTVEFLVDDNLEFYFLEMNTRIQVEHPVTELVTGIDIVEQQIKIATGEPLRIKQANVEMRGHAIEARLYAEDPADNYMPQAGTICNWVAPADNKNVRCDTGIESNQAITSFYDPMIAKIIGFGMSRSQALRHLTNALRNTTIHGIKTNRDFLIQLLDADCVREGQYDTSTLQCTNLMNELIESPYEMEKLVIAGLINACQSLLTNTCLQASMVPPQKIIFCLSEKPYEIELAFQTSNFTPLEANVSIKPYVKSGINEVIHKAKVQLWSLDSNSADISYDAIRTHYHYSKTGSEFWVSNRLFSGQVTQYEPDYAHEGDSDGLLKAPMDGRVLDVYFQQGEKVVKGQTLAVLDAMKIEHPIQAPFDALIETISITKNQQVKNKQILITLVSLN